MLPVYKIAVRHNL